VVKVFSEHNNVVKLRTFTVFNAI